MSSPITWRNVGSDTNPAAISSVFDAATRNFSGGLGALGGILKDTQAVQDNNVKAIDEAAKQAYLDQLQGIKTVDGLEQARPSLEQARASLSVAARAATRGADEARTTALRTNLTAGQTFGDQQTDRTDLAAQEQIKALTAKGDLVGAKALLDASTFRKGAADLYSGIHTTDRARLGETRADTLYGQGQETYQHGLTMRPLADEATRNSAELGRLNLTEAKYNDTERTRVRGIDDLATQTIRDAQATQGAARQQVDAGLVGYRGYKNKDGTLIPLGRNNDGSLITLGMPEEEKDAIRAHLKTTNGASLEPLLGGDTANVAAARASILAAGAKPSDMSRLDPILNSSLSTVPVAPTGKEAAIIDRNQRIRDVTAKMNSAQFTPMTTPGAIGTTLDTAKTIIDQIHPVGSYRNQNWSEAIANMKGIEAIDPTTKKPVMGADGKTPIRVLPGPEAIKKMLRGIDNSYFGFGNGDIKAAIKAWENAPENATGAAAAINDQLLNQIRGIDIEKPAATK